MSGGGGGPPETGATICAEMAGAVSVEDLPARSIWSVRYISTRIYSCPRNAWIANSTHNLPCFQDLSPFPLPEPPLPPEPSPNMPV